MKNSKVASLRNVVKLAIVFYQEENKAAEILKMTLPYFNLFKFCTVPFQILLQYFKMRIAIKDSITNDLATIQLITDDFRKVMKKGSSFSSRLKILFSQPGFTDDASSSLLFSSSLCVLVFPDLHILFVCSETRPCSWQRRTSCSTPFGTTSS